MPSPPGPIPRRAVIGVAIIEAGRLLVARRTYPPALAGRWELPGGKAEPGEAPAMAAAREVREELGCTVEITGWLPGAEPIDERHELRVCLARLVAGRPVSGEHDRLVWATAAELADLDWLVPDRPFLPALRAALAADRTDHCDGSDGPRGLPDAASRDDERSAT